MSDVTVDDKHVRCTRCRRPRTESYTWLGACECGNREWEYRPPNPFPLAEEVSLTNE